MSSDKPTAEEACCGIGGLRIGLSVTPLCIDCPLHDLVMKQEPLGRDFEKVLYDSLWSLYVRS